MVMTFVGAASAAGFSSPGPPVYHSLLHSEYYLHEYVDIVEESGLSQVYELIGNCPLGEISDMSDAGKSHRASLNSNSSNFSGNEPAPVCSPPLKRSSNPPSVATALAVLVDPVVPLVDLVVPLAVPLVLLVVVLAVLLVTLMVLLADPLVVLLVAPVAVVLAVVLAVALAVLVVALMVVLVVLLVVPLAVPLASTSAALV
ncbi:hypothetical protein IW148_003252 [Coemansia sp. RSA 1199]|nr:hypothetical protein IW148_003252 [Coemansia sp. RSA 1199]